METTSLSSQKKKKTKGENSQRLLPWWPSSRPRVERSPANFRRACNPRHKTDRSYRRRRRETRLIPRHRSEVSRGGMKLEEDDGPREIRTAEIRAVKYVASGK